MAETRVDLLHLLEDLRDAYTQSLEETILTELVANALDSGARTIALTIDAAERAFWIRDDGAGMARKELRRFHDIAASTKLRGQGIGFAGVGVKLGLLAADQVVTETRRPAVHVATAWHLAGRHRAPWKWIPPPGLVSERGTAVRLTLQNPLSPLLDAGFVEAAVERTFPALLQPAFDAVLASHYPSGVRFVVNGREIPRRTEAVGATLAVRIGRRRKPTAVGYLTRSAAAVPEASRGLRISTLGKLIRGGWDWLGLAPAGAEHIAGLIEAPVLAECLALNKADFVRVGRRGAIFLAYRKAIQEAVSAQLAQWGEVREATDEARRRRARPVERDLERVLVDLADDFPMLLSLVERRAGQRSLRARGSNLAHQELTPGGAEGLALSGPPERVDDLAAPEPPRPAASDDAGDRRGPNTETGGSEPMPDRDDAAPMVAGRAASADRRAGHYALSIDFASRPDDGEIARLVESTVWVNEAHPAYRRAAASRAEGYHLALAVALALAPLAVEPKDAHSFVTTFLARWGEALDRPLRRRRRAQ